MSDYVGEYSYLGTTLRQANIEPMPSLSDVRRVVTEFGVLPLGEYLITTWRLEIRDLSDIGAMVKVTSAHLWECGLTPGKAFSYSLPKQGLINDQHVKHQMPTGFSFTSNLLLDYHIKQHKHMHILHLNLCSARKLGVIVT